MIRAALLAIVLLMISFSCGRRPVSGTDFLEERYRYRKINVINVSDEVRFEPGTGALMMEEESEQLNQLIQFLTDNPDAEVELRVSHIHRSEEYHTEGYTKSINLRNYFISQGIAPSRLKSSTFLDRRSKYPYNSYYRKVLLVVTNI
ncbi:hypothetical protein D770_19340 [Flammeovirgaceae bacterium 311]|nr:hypothetical protein D770_19340 [Flammeovirgaceae bacterium 311]